MKLSALLAAIGAPLPTNADPEITDITCDSRKVAPGSLFVALPGARVDGHTFIPTALNAGAAAIVACRPAETGDVPLIPVERPREALALLSAAFGVGSNKIYVTGRK